MTIIERFLNYIKFDTQSNPYTKTTPSTKGQLELAKYLIEELKQIGIANAYMDQFGYVYGYIESNTPTTITVGLIAHMDTSYDSSGKNIMPIVLENYDGTDILLNKDLKMILSPIEFPSLKQKIGHTLIHTDGTTLLGADDKAGIAIIIGAVEKILKEKLPHPNIIITFTPDEEIGEGPKNFDYNYYKKHNCQFAYTLDGGKIDEINFENFNAASATITIKGKSIHPGSAKGKMINSILVAMEFQTMLPQNQIPALTEGYEGFFHLNRIKGGVEQTTLEYIIRNHNRDLFEKQKELILEIKNYLNKKYRQDLVTVNVEDSYRNMREIILQHPEVLEYAIKALKRNNIEPVFVPIRGGTDGAEITYHGIYTPNLGSAGENFHGPFEYLDITDLNKMIDVVITLLKIVTE